jgi:CRP-like cAMP-binding protein
VARAGEEVRWLFILLSGRVSGEMMDFAGKVIVIEEILPPRPLATAFLFGDQNRFPVTISAVDPTEILSVPSVRFLSMMQENKRILQNFLHAVSSRGQFLSNKIRYLSFSSIREKLAQYFLDLSLKQGGDRIRLVHSQAQLSELFGVTRPSVGRAISRMNREGFIRTDGKMLELTDREGLSAILKKY